MTLPFPIQFASNGPQWAQGFDAWYDYTKPQGSQLLAFPPATDTHSATVYAQSSSGVWQAIPANVPSRTDLGMQTVPTRTNSIRNNSNVGAVPGSPGTPPTNWSAVAQTGYAWQLVGTGTAFGLPYIDYRLSGTDALGRVHTLLFETSTGITAATAETWTESAFIQLVGGSLTGVSASFGMDENTSVGGFVAFGTQSISPTSAFARYSFTRTLSGGATVARVLPFLRLTTGAGATVDVTIRIYAPQMELGAFASAPILTASGAATVNGNQQVVGLTGRLSAGVGGIIQLNQLETGSTLSRIVEFSDGTSNNGLRVYIAAPNSFACEVTAGGANQGVVGGSTATQPAGMMTLAFAYSANFFTARVVGQAAPTPDTVSTYPSGLSQLAILGRGFDAARNSYGQARRLALRFGAQDASTFADLFAKATILAAVS